MFENKIAQVSTRANKTKLNKGTKCKKNEKQIEKTIVANKPSLINSDGRTRLTLLINKVLMCAELPNEIVVVVRRGGVSCVMSFT